MRAIPRRRQPTTPGEILREEFLIPHGMTQKQPADHLTCDVKVVNRIVNGRTSVTAEMALKLGATFRDHARVLAQRSEGRRPPSRGPARPEAAETAASSKLTARPATAA